MADNNSHFQRKDFTRNLITKREAKGRSTISFPKNYVVIDIETTGLDPRHDEILELSALRIQNDTVIDTYTSLVRPTQYISDFISELTGITNESVKDAPNIENVLASYLEFIGDELVVGYSVHFDVNFIYDAASELLNQSFSNEILDVLRIARKIVKTTKNHKLKSIADYYELDYKKLHRGEADSLLCLNCFINLKKDALMLYGSENEFIKSFNNHGNKLKASDVKSTKQDFNTEHPLYEKECVFTGTLSQATRKEAMQLVVDYGGTNRDAVTKKTSYLVLGDTDYSKVKNGKSSKLKKAEKNKLDGLDIEIISEKVFYDLLIHS